MPRADLPKFSNPAGKSGANLSRAARSLPATWYLSYHGEGLGKVKMEGTNGSTERNYRLVQNVAWDSKQGRHLWSIAPEEMNGMRHASSCRGQKRNQV